MTIPNGLIIDTNLCTDCRSCQLACHFHHTGYFGIDMCSVHIRYVSDTSHIDITYDDTCDQCIEETVPFCVKFCIPKAIQIHL